MTTQNTNDNEPAITELAASLRNQRTANQRSTRAMARALADHGFESQRIAHLIDVPETVVARLLAVDGSQLCIRCAFQEHAHCTLLNDSSRPCECDCRSDA